MLPIDILQHQSALKTKTENGKVYLFDVIRKKYLVRQPEELVRQLFVHYLLAQAYNPNRIGIEKSLRVNTLLRRCDILVYDLKMNPWLLVECKAPEVPISQDTFDQIARYNLPLRVNYLVVTNGLESYCCSMDYEKESWTFLEAIPSYPTI